MSKGLSYLFNFLPNNTISGCPNSEHSQMTNRTQKVIFVSDMTENIEEKGENAGNQHLLFPQFIQKLSSVDCVVMV